HNEAVSGVFWTHPTVNVTVAYDQATQTITVTNNSGQGFWNISITGNSGAGNSTSCDDLSVVNDVNNGLSLSLSTSLCTGNDQGFTIMGADETGTTTGFRMDFVAYLNRVNAYVAYW
ncbi:MAG: hypothetical protein HKN79_04860, partial [Flavobacteriales bacterium]|nr:hypothetical protein [Flavobacteriales bacterium]